ncbi:MAG: right-handed parallel beta-helix repeat-containing protein [Candidatus Brocadiia bacterium]
MSSKRLIYLLCVYFCVHLCLSVATLWAFDSDTPVIVENASYQSVGSGNWESTATWTPAGIPQLGDTVTVLAGHTVSITSSGICGVLSVQGTLVLNAVANPVTLTVGSSLTNGGVVRFDNASVNTATIISTGSANLNGAFPDWNNQTKCQIGGFILPAVTQFYISGTPVITMVGDLTSSGGINIASGATLRQKSGTKLYCSGGNFWINGYFDMEAITGHSYVYMNGGSNSGWDTNFTTGYRIKITGSGYLSATGTSEAARCVFDTTSSSSTYSSNMFVADGGSALLKYCNIFLNRNRLRSCSTPPSGDDGTGWEASLYANGVDGNNDTGRIGEGLTVDNCLVYGGYGGIMLNNGSANKVTNTQIYGSCRFGLYLYHDDTLEPNYIIQNVEIYGCTFHGVWLQYKARADYPIVGLKSYSNGWFGMVIWDSREWNRAYFLVDSQFGVKGNNGYADIGVQGGWPVNPWGTNYYYPAAAWIRASFYNCVFDSTYEIQDQLGSTSWHDGWNYFHSSVYGSSPASWDYQHIISYKHQGRPGSIRVRGDVRTWVQHVGESADNRPLAKLRTDTETYRSWTTGWGYSIAGSGDANVQKIVEVNRQVGYDATANLGTGLQRLSQIRFGSANTTYMPTDQHTEWVGTADKPIIVRSQFSTQRTDGNYRDLYYLRGFGSAGAKAYIGMKYVSFSDICEGLWIDANTRIEPTSTAEPTDSGLDYCNFANNFGGGNATYSLYGSRHLYIQTEAGAPAQYKNITATGCSFDTSPLNYNVQIEANNQITFTNWTNPRRVLGTVNTRTIYGVGSDYTTGYPASAVCWYMTPSNTDGPMQFRSNGAAVRFDAVTNWQYENGYNNWVSATRTPTSGDLLVVRSGHTLTVPITDSDKSWACAGIEVQSGGIMQFNMGDPAGGDVILTLDEGGSIWNSGTINFANAANDRKVIIKVKNSDIEDNPTPWVFRGTTPVWLSGLNIELSEARVWTALNLNAAMTMTFTGNMTTQQMNIGVSGAAAGSGALLKFKPSPSGAKKTWIVQDGGIYIGVNDNTDAAYEEGGLDLYENSETMMNSTWPDGNYNFGIWVYGRGRLTMTGNSSGNRNCFFTAKNKINTFIRIQNDAQVLIRYCDLSSLGWLDTWATPTRLGINITNMNGNNGRSGFLIDSNDIHDSYCAVSLWNAKNNSSSNGQGITNNKIYNIADSGIWMFYDSDSNYIANNEVYNCLYGIRWGRYTGGNSWVNNTNNNNYDGYCDSNIFQGNKIHDNYSAGMYFYGHSNGGALNTPYAYMPATSNIFNGEYYYGNTNQGIYFGLYAFNNWHVFNNCTFGKDSGGSALPNGQDVYMVMANNFYPWGNYNGWQYQTCWGFQFRNCLFASPTEIYLHPSYNRIYPSAGNYYNGVFSYCHDQTPGLTKVWGHLFVPTGTMPFNYNTASRPGGEFPGVNATPDATTKKQLVFCGMPGSSTSYTDFNDLLGMTTANATTAIVDMSSGNTADRATTVTTDQYLNAYNWLGIRIYGTLKANYVNFSKLPTTGLYINGTNARLDPFNNVSFSSMYPGSRCLYLDGTTSIPVAQRTFSGCSFDNSANTDVAINWSGAGVTFTNFANDYPGTKDQLYAGSVLWQVNQTTTAQNGPWSVASTWQGGLLPSDWANVTINHQVSVSGTVKLNSLTVGAAGQLSLDASSVATTLQLVGNGTISNTGTIRIADSTQAVAMTSSNANLFSLDGAGTFDLNGKNISIGLMDCKSTLNVPNGSVLTIANDIITRNVTIAQGGEIRHQTSGKFWWTQGDMSVSGNLKIGANTSLKFSCASHGQYGITLESTGYMEAKGSDNYVRNCYLTRLGSYNPYIYMKAGSEAFFQFANISYFGADAATKYGIYAQNVNAGAGEGLTIDRCNITGNYQGVILDGCTNNTITITSISNCTDSGLVILGSSGNNTIDNSTFVNNTQAGVRLGSGNRTSQVMTNISISGNAKGVWVYSDSGSQSDLIVDSTINGNSTADIYFEPNLNGAQQLMTRNTTLGSTTRIVSSDRPGNSVILRKYNGVLGATVFAGDIVIAGTKKFNYAEETYTGDGDANVQKRIYLDQAAAGFNSGKSRIKVPAGAELQIAGTAAYPTIFTKLSESPNPWSLLIDGGTITATYATFGYLDADGANFGNTGILNNLDNCSFTTTSGSHITINNGADKTLSGCTFDNTGNYTVSANSNGITPTTVRFINYTTSGFSAGTRDNEQNNSSIIWQSVISLTNSSGIDATSADFYHNDQDKSIMKLKLGPISPVGSSHTEKILKKIKVWLGGQYFKDSDVSAVKIFKDVDLDDAFSPLSDTLISSGLDTLTSGTCNITLTQAQVLSGTFFVVVDFSDTASLDAQIRGEIRNSDYFTLESPHQMTAFSFIPVSVARTIQPASIRADMHVKKLADTSYIGDNVYNLSGSQQEVTYNTNNNITITYNIRIQNDSPTTNDYFKIKGTSGVVGWTVSYYDESNNQEITSDIINVNGWRCPPGSGTLVPSQTYLIRMEVTPSGQAVDSFKEITVTAISGANPALSLRDMVKTITQIKPYMPDMLVKSAGGSYSGSDIYDPPKEQLLEGNVAINNTVTYYVKVENDGTSNGSFLVTGSALPTGWSITYYNDDTGADITSSIRGSGWTTGTLIPGNSKGIRIEAKPGQDRLGGEQTTILTWVKSIQDTAKTDQVKIMLTVTGGLQPDLMVKKYTDADTAYFRNDAAYEDGATTLQSVSNELREGESYVTYYIKLQNDGSYVDTFSVTGTGNGAGTGSSVWAISYYDGTTDITGNIIGTGWISPSLSPGSSYVLLLRVWSTAGEVGDYRDTVIQARSIAQTAKIDAVKARAYLSSIYVADALISNNNIDWVGNNVRENPATDAQKTTQFLLPTIVATYYIKIENDAAGAADSYTVTGDASADGWMIQYFDAPTGGVDITPQITNVGSGWNTGSLAGDGGSTIIRVNISYDPIQVSPATTKQIYLYVNSYTTPLKKDSVKAVVISHSYQPDIQVKLEGSSYQYDGTPYSNDPADQNFSPDEWINNNQVITYYYKIENDGTTDVVNGYSLTATQAPANWTIKYYHDVNQNSPGVISDDVEITSNIINVNGWLTGLITASGGSKIIYAKVTPTSNVAGNTTQAIAVNAIYSPYWQESDAAQATVKITPRYTVNARIKKNGGSYVGDGYYPPIQQDAALVNQSVDRNGTVTYYIKINNDGNLNLDYVITGTGNGTGFGGRGNWSVKYFYPSNTEITTDVTGAGWPTPSITFGNFIEIMVEVKPDNAVQGDTNYEIQLHGSRSTPQFTYDAVSAVTMVNKAYQPDNLVSNDDSSYDGDGIYTPSDSVSTKTQLIGRNQFVTYYVKILNDGNINEVFTVTGSSAPAGWTVSYYVDESGWVDRTSAIKVGTYNTASITYLDDPSFAKAMIVATPGSSVTATSKANIYLIASAKNSVTEKKDTVLTETTCLVDYGVDVLIKAVTETVYSGDSFIGDPVTDPDEIKTQSVDNYQVASYHIRIENEGNTDTTFKVTATATPSGWVINYRHNNSNPSDPNGSDAFTPGTTTFTLPSNGVKIIRAELSPQWSDANASGGIMQLINIVASKSDNDDIRDSVATKTTVNYSYQPDMMVKRYDELDAAYVRNDSPYEAYNPPTSPSNQFKSGSADYDNQITYYIKIQNDGNTDENITISGTGTWDGVNGILSGWGTITYYLDDADPGTDITQAMIEGTYSFSSAQKFSGNDITIKAVCRPNSGMPGGQYHEVFIYSASTTNGSKADSVKVSTVVMSASLPDIYMMNNGEGTQTNKDDPAYLRNGPPYQPDSNTNQIKTQLVSNRPGAQSVTYYIMVQNDGTAADTLSVVGQGDRSFGGGNWTVRYYDVDGGNLDISDAVTTTGAGAAFSLNAGLTRLLKLIVMPDTSVIGSTTLPVTVTVTSTMDGNLVDAVIAQTTVSNNYQPDVSISVDDSSYTRDGAAYQSSVVTDQAPPGGGLTVDRNAIATYYIKIQNDGNSSTSIAVTGTAGTADSNDLAGWTISYYTFPAMTDITGQIIGSGWTQSYPASGENKIAALVTPRKYSSPASPKIILISAVASNDSSEDAVKSTTTVNAAYQADAWVKEQGGSYSFDNTYESTVSAQIKTLDVSRAQTATYYVTLQNDGNSSADIKITTADEGDSNWTIRFYDGLTDITSDITSTGKTYALSADGTKELMLTVAVGYNTPANQTYSVTMNLSSTPSGDLDQVRVTTRALSSYQPDTWIALQGDFLDETGSNVYSPTAQTKIQNAPNGQTLTYYIRLQNDGNVTDSYTVTGTSGDVDWVISYYNNSSGTDITTQVVNGLYNTGSVSQGATVVPDIRIELAALPSAFGNNSKNVLLRVTASNGLNSDEIIANAVVSTVVKPDVLADLTGIFVSPTGDNNYSPPDNITTQTVLQDVAYAAPVATYYIKIQNDGNTSDSFTVTSSAIPGGATWQVELGAPISQVLTVGQSLNWGGLVLAKDAYSSPIMVKISANTGTLANDQLVFDISAYSGLDQNKNDYVRTQTRFTNYYRPDVLVMKEGDGDYTSQSSYQFNATYSPATQTYSSLIDNSQTITYYIRVENDGAQADFFTLSSNVSTLGWTVSYYKIDNTDITNNVSNGVFTTASLSPYSGIETIKVLVTASSSLGSGDSCLISFTATSSQQMTAFDTASVQNTVRTAYKVDLSVKGSGSYVGENVYLDVDSQTVTQTVMNGGVVSYYVKIGNQGNIADAITVSATTQLATGWTVSYYNLSGQDITNTNVFVLNPSVSQEFVVQISAATNLAAYVTNDVDFIATSSLQSTITDTSRARASVMLSTRVDLALRGDSEFNDNQDGDGIYITNQSDIADDSVQHKKHAVGLSEPTTYYIRIQNDGNYSDTYLLTSTGGTADWTVRYYEQSGQLLSEITSQVIGSGWTSSSIASGGNTVVLITLIPGAAVASDSVYTVYARASSVTEPLLVDTVKTSTKYMPLEIGYPNSNKMIAQKPVIIGDAKPNELISIVNTKTGEILGQTQSDINGKYRLKLPNDIPIGTVISLKPVGSDGTEGANIANLTVSDSPSTDDVPVINGPVTGTIIIGGICNLNGQAKPGSVVTLQVNTESKGQSTLYDFGFITATADSSGNYELSVRLKGGVRSISIACNGGISDIIDVVFVDPTGVVYDSITGEPIKDATVTLEYNDPVSGWITARMGIEIGSPLTVDDDSDVATPDRANANPWVTGLNGRYQWNVIAGEYRLRVSNTNYIFPGSTDTMTALSKKVQEGGVDKDKNIARGTATFTVAAAVWEIDVPLDATGNLVKVTKKANKKEVSVGEVLTYEVKVSNESTTRLKDVYVHDVMPAGFKYVKNSAVTKIGSADWQVATEPTGGITKMFYLGNITAKGTATDTITLRYQLVVGAGALFGEYKNIASAAYYNGRSVSNEAIAKVRVIPDPLFDYATIIGKVFMDANDNGIQDEGEVGMANVKIMTEDGITIITDKDGKYHVAGIKPQTKVLKVDENSLPFNSKITTMNPAVARFTAGARLEKINFGVKTSAVAASERKNAAFAIFVTVKEGIPRITIGKSEIPLNWNSSETKELRLQNIAVTINEKSLMIDPVKGYKGEIIVKLDDPAIRVWARDGYGREAVVKGQVPPTKLETMVKRSSESMEVVSDLESVLSPEIMELKQGKLVKSAEFKIITNYPNFIENWLLEILEPIEQSSLAPILPLTGADELCADDEGGFVIDKVDADKKDKDDKKQGEEIKTIAPVGYQVFKEFRGTRADVGKPISWDGRSGDGKRIIEPGKQYRFILTVIDRMGRTDQTREGIFSVTDPWTVNIRKITGQKMEVSEELIYVPAKGFQKQNIPVEGKLYSISGLTSPTNQITISTAAMPDMLTIKPLEDGSFETELYVPATEEELIIQALSSDGLMKSTISEDIKISGGVKEEFTYVGVIDAMVGSNGRSGDTARLDAFEGGRGVVERLYKDGTYTDIRAAGFIKMRTKSDWKITASVDTDRAGKNALRNSQSQMFKYIDPDKFYPLYGDQSTRIDEASNTQGAIFLKVEKGLSDLLVGSYNTGFSGSELAPYNRSLYGGKMHFGWQQNGGITLFGATARQMASHDELLGTGGSLYYLQHKDVMDGTEKVSIEVRDKVTGLVIEVKTLSRGDDYDIDYRYGRIMFYRPVNSVVASNTLISNEILEGNPTYVLVDYEYLPDGNWKNEAGGARITQSFGDMLNVGVTYVKEARDLNDYLLMGTDISAKIGKYGEAKLEYAKSEYEGINGFVSYNGGINDWSTLTNPAVSNGGSAYKVGVNLDIGGMFMNRPQEISTRLYFQRIEAGFSSAGGSSASQQGTDKFGLEIGAKLGENDTVLGRFDNQKILDNGNVASGAQVGASETQTGTFQLVHLQSPMKLTGEYRYQTVKSPVVNPLMKAEAQQALAARIEYELNKQMTVFAEQQGTLSGKSNNQTSVGATMKLSEKTTGTIQETAGNNGNSTRFGITTNVSERHSLYTNYEIVEGVAGQKTENIILGEKEQVSSKLGLYREERFAVRSAEDKTYGGLFGTDYALTSKWGMTASYERSDVNVIQTRDALALGVTYKSHPQEQDLTRVRGYLKGGARGEYRKEDSTSLKRTSLLTANNVYYQLNEDMALSLKLNLSQTKNETTGQIEARFTEVVLGTAYRPIKDDKYNFLGKISYLDDEAPLSQGDMAKTRTKALIFSLEGAEDVVNNFQIVEKLAYRRNTEIFTNIKNIDSDVYLVALRLNYRIRSESIDFLDKLKLGLEYRILSVGLADDKKSGAVFEIDREVGRFVHLGFGYNFVDFSDNLAEYGKGYKVQGAFIRLTTKF